MLIVLYVGTQLAASAVTAFSADPMQRRIMLALPFVFAIFIINFPAGLIVYWITTNVWTIGQQLAVKKLFPKPEPRDFDAEERREGQTRAREAGGARRRRGGEQRPPRRTRKASARRPRRRSARRQRQRGQRPAAQPAQKEEALGPPPLGRLRPSEGLWRTARSRSTRAAPDDSVAEASGDTLGEAKWTAMKRLEPRYPGITAECVRSRCSRSRTAAARRACPRRSTSTPGARSRDKIPEEPAERVRAIVGRVVHALGLRATVDIEETDDEIRATVNGEDLGLLIGKHGATIDALQHLVFRAAFQGREGRKQVMVDAAGYRERRETALHRMADRAAAEALRFDRPVELEPMRAGERKIVHLHLQERGDVETHSEGDEPDRRLVVTPVRGRLTRLARSFRTLRCAVPHASPRAACVRQATAAA